MEEELEGAIVADLAGEFKKAKERNEEEKGDEKVADVHIGSGKGDWLSFEEAKDHMFKPCE